jgi:hypothetical protein
VSLRSLEWVQTSEEEEESCQNPTYLTYSGLPLWGKGM